MGRKVPSLSWWESKNRCGYDFVIMLLTEWRREGGEEEEEEEDKCELGCQINCRFLAR